MTDLKTLSPALPQPTLKHSRAALTERRLAQLDAVVILYDNASALTDALLPGAGLLGSLRERRGDDGLLQATLNNSRATQLVAARVAPRSSRFQQLEACRQAATSALAGGARKVALVTATDDPALAADGAHTLLLAAFRMPHFSGKRSAARSLRELTVHCGRKPELAAAAALARGNSLARWLTALPPNYLDSAGYRTLTESLAKQHGWQHRFYSLAALRRKGAGAFVAVAQGSDDENAGIIHLRRAGTGKQRKRVALVGKGIIFDTGGTNLKPFDGMLNMHIDMGGSAVALGTLLALHELDTRVDLDVWLAVTENRTGPAAYKSQDVVTALNGKTIQTIHTDAEGRMVLADTLTLAARAKPDLMLDFATLTGACVNAVTPRYSGVFTNRESLHDLLIEHGTGCGERVWPFRIGGEFLALLKSETADIMQCAPSGSGDHILAATFLNEFVPGSIPWVHMDLSACEHKGGLGAVGTDLTGFGVTYAATLLGSQLKALVGAR